MKIKNMKQVKEHMKDMNMKRLFRRNQIIITTLAVMIAAAGYLNYAGKKDLANGNRVYEAGAMDISDEDILAENQAASLNGQAGLQEIQSLDQDPSDLDAVSDMDGAQAAADSGTDANQLAQAGDVLRQPVADIHGGCLGNGLVEVGAVRWGGYHEDIL